MKSYIQYKWDTLEDVASAFLKTCLLSNNLYEFLLKVHRVVKNKKYYEVIVNGKRFKPIY